jgi:hypothetical protein
MIRTRFKRVLLVAPDVVPNQLLVDYKEVKHICTKNAVFPAIYELNPNVIVFDVDFMGKDMEKVLRRIQMNKFYNKIKIYCYKTTPNEKADSLLKALGVDDLIYRDELPKAPKSRSLLNNFNPIIDAAIMKWAASVG